MLGLSAPNSVSNTQIKTNKSNVVIPVFRCASVGDVECNLLQRILKLSWLAHTENPCHLVCAKYLHVLGAATAAWGENGRCVETGELVQMILMKFLAAEGKDEKKVLVRRRNTA